VNTLRGLAPFHLSRRDLNVLAFSAVAVLDQEGRPLESPPLPCGRIAMPRHGFAGPRRNRRTEVVPC